MGIVARAPEKVFRTPRLSRMSGFQKLIKPTPEYIMIPICYRNGRAYLSYRNSAALPRASSLSKSRRTPPHHRRGESRSSPRTTGWSWAGQTELMSDQTEPILLTEPWLRPGKFQGGPGE